MISDLDRLETMVNTTLQAKYDKGDSWDCGYRAGLTQVKIWITAIKKRTEKKDA